MTTFEGKNSREHIDRKPKKIYEIIITIAKPLVTRVHGFHLRIRIMTKYYKHMNNFFTMIRGHTR
jgi:hypothetical protein